jgi:sugar phosphate isomerase/epimerase
LCTDYPLWVQHAGMGAFRIVALTDRLPQDLRQMAAWAKQNRLSGLEIGRIGGKPVHEFANPRDTAELKAALAAANLIVPSLATSVFLCPLEDEGYREQLPQLDRCLELARALGAPLVVVRTFLRKGGLEENWNKLAGYFREPVRRAREVGITLGVVNDPETFIGTGRELARFIEAVGSPQLKAVWDPCAAIYDIDRPEISYPDGYERLKRHIALVRVRDVDRQQHSGKLQECVLGDGLVGWAKQIRALGADRFPGPLSVSTGWHPGVRPSGAVYAGDSSPEGAQKAAQIYVAGLRELEAPEPPPQGRSPRLILPTVNCRDT